MLRLWGEGVKACYVTFEFSADKLLPWVWRLHQRRARWGSDLKNYVITFSKFLSQAQRPQMRSSCKI